MQLLKLDHWGLGAGAHARRCRSCSYSRLAIRGTIRTSCTFKSWWTDGMIIEKHRAQNCSWSVNSVIKLSVCYFTNGSLVTRCHTGKFWNPSENKQQQNSPPACHCFYTLPQWHKAIWMYSQTFCPLRWSTLYTMLWTILKINIQAATEILMLIWQGS